MPFVHSAKYAAMLMGSDADTDTDADTERFEMLP